MSFHLHLLETNLFEFKGNNNNVRGMRKIKPGAAARSVAYHAVNPCVQHIHLSKNNFPLPMIIPPAFMPRGLKISSFPSYVRSFVRFSFRRVEFASKFCVKVSQVVHSSATTYQKAFIF